ncbi:heme exporter protein CcmD [Scandinavium manionii]|uniref:heme exporter protein CcmD n=1 Tax=Scandinavium manionii TaxID=2926520 RepID=UPI001358BCD9|nr:heme exporter protein CcmD [Scandinavium manionii]
MVFNSWHAFFNMGGYAGYVWTSFGLSLLMLVVLLLSIINNKKVLLTNIHRQQARIQRRESLSNTEEGRHVTTS